MSLNMDYFDFVFLNIGIYYYIILILSITGILCFLSDFINQHIIKSISVLNLLFLKVSTCILFLLFNILVLINYEINEDDLNRILKNGYLNESLSLVFNKNNKTSYLELQIFKK